MRPLCLGKGGFTVGAHLGGETQIRDATRTFWPQIPTVRRGARGLGLRPEATLGLRLIPLKRGLAPPESCPVAPPAAPEAPRQESAPGRYRGAARASEAFPQVPWTAPSSRRPPSAPQSARSAHLDGRRQRAALLELGPQACARAEADGGGDGEERRRGMARRCVAHPPPPPRQAGSTRAGRLRRRSVAVLCLRSAVPSALAPASPPPPPSVQARASTGASGARRHLPHRHPSSTGRVGASSGSTSHPPLATAFWCSLTYSLPPPPPLTRVGPLRAGRLLRRSAAGACALRPCGRHAQAHAARPAARPSALCPPLPRPAGPPSPICRPLPNRRSSA